MLASAPLSASQRLARLERRYSLVVFFNWFAVILPGAVLVLFAQSRGLSLAEIGLYGAVYSATAALLELPTGNLADQVGRKRVALLGYGLVAVSKVALLFAFSLPGFLTYAVLGGLARALSSGALDAWYVEAVRDIDPEADLQPRLARLGTVELLALGVGSLTGAGLSALLARGGNASPLAAVILASLVLHLLTLLVTWRLIEEAPRAHSSPLAALRQGLVSLPSALQAATRTVRASPLLPRLLLLEGVSGLVIAASETFWQPFFAARFGLGGPSTTLLGVLLGGCFLAGMLGNLASGRLLRLLRGRTDRLGVATQLTNALALLALAWQTSGSLWLAAGLFWLSYLARTAFSSSFLTVFNTQLSDDRRSLMLSVLSVSFFLGVSLGNLVLGAVSSHWSIPWAWTLTAGVLLLSLSLFPNLRDDDRS
jgi:MFS family permease